MDNENDSNWFVGLLIIAVIYLAIQSHSQSVKISKLQDTVSSYDDALNNANDNIDQANTDINDAKSNAWSDYDTMGQTLDNLQDIETVTAPYIDQDLMKK